VIVLDHLTFRYPGVSRDAVREVTLTIDEGAFVLVAGDSGSGKTTLARALVGLVPHFSGGTVEGSVLVDGRDTRTTPPRALADVCGFVDQDPEAQAVVDRVEDEIVFAMENLGVEPLTMRARLEEILDAIGLAGLRARRLSELSGGERQRVAIAAALASHPRCLVLDEPTSQLDPQSAEDVLGVLHRLNADLGIAIVLVEHRLERVVQHADRLIVLAEGRVVADGMPRAVLAGGAVSTPLSRLARALGWDEVPLTVREGRAFAASLRPSPLRRPRPAPGNEIVCARGVRVARGGVEVLRGADVTLARGETLAIVGRNGSGKTTLLRTLMGLLHPHAGHRIVAGMDPDTVPLERIASRVAYVPQVADSLLFHDTVRDEVRFTLAARAPSADTDEVIERAGMSAFAATDPRDLSAGERVRAAILAATAGDPDLILLDEPTRGMDARAKEMLARQIDAWRGQGRAVILVTHDAELVARTATRALMLSEGEVVLDGPVSEALGGSALFGSQMTKVFGDPRILTVEDALAAVGAR
jgi:energy-coupling factor transport system ATP-binding protein